MASNWRESLHDWTCGSPETWEKQGISCSSSCIYAVRAIDFLENQTDVLHKARKLLRMFASLGWNSKSPVPVKWVFCMSGRLDWLDDLAHMPRFILSQLLPAGMYVHGFSFRHFASYSCYFVLAAANQFRRMNETSVYTGRKIGLSIRWWQWCHHW